MKKKQTDRQSNQISKYLRFFINEFIVLNPMW